MEKSIEEEPIYNDFKTNGEKSYAREENFFDSLRILCCTKLRITQFIAIVSIVEFLVFFISIAVYGLNNEAFLAPDYDGLKHLGAADAKSTKNDYQFYRIIMPMFLHAHAEHICGNVVFQLYFGSGIEFGIGFWRMVLLYILSTVGGILLAITFHPESYGVGASCSGFGLLGFDLAYVITNWGYMDRTKPY